jgi:hypothetical protein
VWSQHSLSRHDFSQNTFPKTSLCDPTVAFPGHDVTPKFPGVNDSPEVMVMVRDLGAEARAVCTEPWPLPTAGGAMWWGGSRDPSLHFEEALLCDLLPAFSPCPCFLFVSLLLSFRLRCLNGLGTCLTPTHCPVSPENASTPACDQHTALASASAHCPHQRCFLSASCSDLKPQLRASHGRLCARSGDQMGGHLLLRVWVE